ncbi:MAG: serine hydrolase [Proteobacteria bacterium]|nr:serine hydrolase [Pseudomonadota bacterium]
MALDVAQNPYDFSHMHSAIARFVEDDILAGAASVVLKDNQIVDFHLWGYADIEARQPMQEDSIYRIFSNTKIVTAVAAMCLLEDGRFSLDDPLDEYLPKLASPVVLKAGSTDPTAVEPARSRPTIRQLMCHNAGYTYGFLMESPIDALYNRVNIMDPNATLADMVSKLGQIPLAYQPGSRWQYSVSSDILARLVEVWSGLSFSEFLSQRIFGPLGMIDTGFHVPGEKLPRLTTNYAPINPAEPMKGGLRAVPDTYAEPKAFHSGGGGLVSTIGDYTRFIQMLVGEGQFGDARILAPETVRLMHTNALPDGIGVQLPNWFMPDTVFGLGLAIKTAPRDGEPDTAVDEFHWGGMAGTHSWISPRAGIAALIFTQRLPGSGIRSVMSTSAWCTRRFPDQAAAWQSYFSTILR